MATAAKSEIKTSEFALTTTSIEDIDKLRSSREQKYPELIESFLKGTKVGEAMEIKNADGSELSETQVKRMYNGIRNYLRYRKDNGNAIKNVNARRAGSRLFLIHEED